MKKSEGVRKPANIKKDARLTIRVSRELKSKIVGIDRVYGVALPKIANECLRAFANTWSKRNRHQLFHSALAHIHPTTKLLTTLQLAGSEDVKTVSGEEYKNVTERGFSAAPVKKTHRPAAITCGMSSRDGSPNNLTCARRGRSRRSVALEMTVTEY